MTAYLPYKKILILIFSAIFAAAIFAVASFAQEKTTESSVGKIGIQVSSPVYNFGIDPGGTAQEIIKVRNVSDTNQTFFLEVFDFKPAGESGTPQFLLEGNTENYSYSLASWINVSKAPITLKPNESAARNFTINVPKNAEPGGRYAGILFGTSPPKTRGTQVAISNKVGSLLLVRVSGDANETAILTEFSTPSNFYEYPPVDFVVRVENKGNVHVVTKGTIDIKNVFGSTVASLSVNEKNGNVLPESIRRFDKENDELTWKPGGLTIGRYTANLLLNYGESTTKQLTGSVSFWVIPWKILLIIFLALIVLILLLIFLIKKYNQWIVSRAEGKSQNSASPGQQGSSQNSPPAQ